jgi:16S rRNA (uracil1498-N3)-methyltransferase
MIRLFVEQPLQEGALVEPHADQHHYLTKVMRQDVGAEVLLFNGRDGEWRAALVEAARKRCRLGLQERVRAQAATPDLELVVALVKRSRLETIVEKAAELGCRRVRLVITRRTNADHTKVTRLQAIATEASEQTGRLDVPEVMEPERLDRIIAGWDQSRLLVFADENAPHASPLAALATRKSSKLAVLVGPEGGFDREERASLLAQPFVLPLSLGPRVMRADTAAVAALALVNAALGDWL